MERNIIVLIDTNGEYPNFYNEIELALYYKLPVEFQRFCGCILCAHQYLIENHEKVLLVWIRPYGTVNCKLGHKKEDIEKYTQLQGVCNFYDMLIQSSGINQIPRIIMHSNVDDSMKPTSTRPDDLFLGFNGLLPSKFCELIKKLISQNA